jgi:hypothetical protein
LWECAAFRVPRSEFQVAGAQWLDFGFFAPLARSGRATADDALPFGNHGSSIHDPQSAIDLLAMRAGCRPWSRKVGLAIVIGGGVMEAVGILVNRWGRGWEGFWEKARRKVRKR